MKTKTIYKTLQNFANKLGDEDFAVSLALCEQKWYISVSCHSSRKYKFDHGGLQRTVEVDSNSSEETLKSILEELVDKYKECLEPREEQKEDIHDAIERTKAIS